MSKPLVAYFRVSTREQGRSGLGIDSQGAAVIRFAAAEGYEVVGEFVEIETGKGADAIERRPQLAEARRHGKCAVAVSKLDRLSRDVHFIGLMAHRSRSSSPSSARTSSRSCCTCTRPSPSASAR